MASNDRRVPDGVRGKNPDIAHIVLLFFFFTIPGGTDLRIFLIQCFNIMMKDINEWAAEVAYI